MFFYYKTTGKQITSNVLTEYVGSNDDFENMGTGAPIGQSFQVNFAGAATAVEIFGARGASSSGTFKVQILTGSMIGTVISDSGSINSTTLTPYASGAQWNKITIPSIALSTGVTYYLKLIALTGAAADEVRWSADTTSAAYTNGESFVNTTAVPANDRMFRILKS